MPFRSELKDLLLEINTETSLLVQKAARTQWGGLAIIGVLLAAVAFGVWVGR